MKKRIFTILFMTFLLGWMQLSAQQKGIKGVVMDENDNPLPGANVLESGTNNGTTTDAKGLFTLSLTKENSTLTVSFIGYISEDIPTNGKSTINVSLKPNASGLSEVVVVGYGTQKKINLTGSVSSVSGEELIKKPVMKTSAALEGLAPGVTVTQSSGQPGQDGGTIRVRGIGTLGNSDPLVLIDGIEGSLDGVDPNDIQDISILKDAASASIYGSRAANGVILVTTKSGISGKIKVNYHAYFGWQRFTDLPKYTDGYTYMTSLNQAYNNEGREPLYSDAYLQEYQQNYKTDPDHYPNVDWQKLVYSGSGFVQNHYLGVSGGSNILKVMGSVSYQDQTGEIPNYSSRQYSFRLNTEMDVTRNLQLRLNLAGRHSPTESPSYSIISTLTRIPPIYSAILSDGRFGTGYVGDNPLATAKEGGTVSNINEMFRGTLQANYQPFNGADIELNFTPQFNDIWEKNFIRSVATYTPESSAPAYEKPLKSSLTESDSRNWENTLHLLFKYHKAFAKHDFHFLGGYEQVAYNINDFDAFRDTYPLPDYQQLNSGSVENWQNSGTGSAWALRSYFGRLNYDFNSKYLFEANLRVDGSSRFAEGHRYGVFPSFSAGWRLSEEQFLKEAKWLSNLKLRASWGQLGNQLIGTYPFASIIGLGANYILGNAPANGAAQTDMANRDISWESSTTKDAGIDVGLFQNRLNITYDYYIRKTSGILLQLPIPAIIGLTSPYQNAGVVKNTGWDLAVSYNNRMGAFKYNIGLNMSDVRNEVLSLKGTGPYISSYSIITEGQPINALYGYKAIGLFQSQDQVDKSPKQFGNYAPGDIVYKDINSDGIINADDREIMGNQIPRYVYGLSFSAEYKDFDLSFLVQGVGKRDVFLYQDAVWAFYNAGKIQTWQLDYWTPDNPNAKYPRLIAETTHNNFQNSSFWVYNAAYVRLKNLQLGYSVPKRLITRTFIENLRVYVSGQNLFTLDHMPKGWDPERPSGGAVVYPISNTFVFGLNLTF